MERETDGESRCSFVWWSYREIRVFCANEQSAGPWLGEDSAHAELLMRLAREMRNGLVD